MPSNERDPLKDPRQGDVVRHINSVIGPGPENRVEAVVGNLIAITYGGSNEVYWMLRERWCESTALTVRYEVLHVAEAREGGDLIGDSLMGRLRQDLPAIRYHLGGVGPAIKLALDDSSRQSNILVAIHALDALLPLLTQPREATQPTAAEVIEAAEKALKSWSEAMNTHGEWDDGCFYYCKRSASELEPRIEGTADALALCARWKESNGGK